MKRIFTSLSILVFSFFSSLAFGQCEDYSIELYSNVGDGGPTSVTWNLTDVNDNTVFSGTEVFSDMVSTNSETVCLEEGQYTLYCTGNTMMMEGNFLATVMLGDSIIYPTNDILFGNATFIYSFNTEFIDVNCEASFTYEETETPGYIEFLSTSTTDGDQLQYAWDFGFDPIPGDSTATYQYDADGSYSVCLNITASIEGQVGCVDQFCTQVEVTGFPEPEICPTGILIEEPVCHTFNFSMVSGPALDGTAIWYLDGQEVSTDTIYSTTIVSIGIHILTVEYQSTSCPSGITLTQEFEVFECACPTEIEIDNQGCFLYHLSVPGGLSGASYSWTVNTSSYTSQEVNYTIAFPSSANVQVIYSGSNCPGGVTLNTTLSYSICGSVCPGQIIKTQVDCNVYELSFPNTSDDTEVTWTINGEQFTGTEIMYTIPAPGVYPISAVVSNPGCPNPVNVSASLTWDDCATVCATDIVVTDLGCNVYLLAADTTEIGSEVEWIIDGSLIPGDSINYTLLDGEPADVTMMYSGEHCSFGNDVSITLEPVACSDECPNFITIVELACNTYQFSLNVSEPDSITWEIDGNVLTGNYVAYILDISGLYDIHAHYDGANCGEGADVFTTIDYLPCEEICPEMIIVENLCNDYSLSIDVNYPQLGAIWTVNGDTTGTGATLNYALPGPGEYYISVYYSGPDCPLGTTLYDTLEYVTCNDVCPTEIIAVEYSCNHYLLTMNNVAPGEEGLWYVNGQATITTDELDIEVTTDQTIHIDVHYTGTQCTDEVVLETDLVWSAAAFTYDIVGSEVSFTNTSTGIPDANYEWNFDGVTSTENSPTYDFEENGEYEVCLTMLTDFCTLTYCDTVIITNACDLNPVIVSVQAEFLSNGSDFFGIAWDQEDFGFVEAEELTLSEDETTAELFFCLPDDCYSFSIMPFDGLNAETIFATAYDPETEMVIGLIALGSEVTDSMTYVGFNTPCEDNVEVLSMENIELYPNPANDVLNIRSEFFPAEMIIADMTGKVVLQTKLNSSNHSIPVSDLPVGIYTLRCVREEKTLVKRFEVIR